MGLMHMVTAICDRIGTRTLAVAVLDAMLVMDTVSRQTIVIICIKSRNNRIDNGVFLPNIPGFLTFIECLLKLGRGDFKIKI